jgi:hypothetical protein
VTRTTFKLQLCVCLAFSLSIMSNAHAAREKEQQQPPTVYTERAKNMLDSLVVDDELGDIMMLSEEEKEEFLSSLRGKDELIYNPTKKLKDDNAPLKIDLRQQRTLEIKLGHTYNSTLTFKDTMGNPWSFEILSDISNKEVVSNKKVLPHILTVRPQKKAGKTNIPILLKGKTSPLMLVFDISDEMVQMNIDIQVEGVGDSLQSQKAKSKAAYTNGAFVEPKLTEEPDKELMLLFITPEGYEQRDLIDEYGEEVDYRDYVAWTKDDKLYIITPHDSFHPAPVDISRSPDGQTILFEYDLVPVVTMQQGNKTVMLYVK